MPRKRKRSAEAPGTQEPRVDDLFYDNPAGNNPADDNPAGDNADGRRTHEFPSASDAETDAVGTGAEEDIAEADEQWAAAGDDEDFALRRRGHPDDDPAHPDHDARAANRRRRLRTGGRWVRSAAVVGVAGVLVWAAGSGELRPVDLAHALGHAEGVPAESPQTAGLSVVTDSTVACVGPELVGLDDPSVPELEQTISIWAGSAPSQALPDGIDPSGEGAVTVDVIGPDVQAGEDAITVRGDAAKLAVSGPRWARVSGTGSLGAGLAASQISVSLEEQERGLSTAACLDARDDSWLVAGGDEVGRVERLVLVNPTGNPVTADVEVLGAQGRVDVAGGRGVVVPANGRQVLLLDALAPREDRPVVHVTSVGGPVVAALAERWLEGTRDRGRELTTRTAAPATDLLIPAVSGPRADSTDTAHVRVGVPGTEVAIVQLRALTPEGPVRVANDVTTIDAGAVVDIDVSDLPEGTHGVEVVADTPVVAAAHVQRQSDSDSVSDLAWVPAVTPTSGLLGVPLTARGDHELARQLSIATLEGAGLEVVSVTGGVSESRALEVPAGGLATIELNPDVEGIWLQVTDGSASAAVISTVEDDLGTLIAGLPLPESPVTRQVRSIAPWLP